MSKVHDKEWKKISFGSGCQQLDTHVYGDIAELVDELLKEKNIEASAFSFSLEVDYMEIVEDRSVSQQMQDDLEPIEGD